MRLSELIKTLQKIETQDGPDVKVLVYDEGYGYSENFTVEADDVLRRYGNNEKYVTFSVD